MISNLKIVEAFGIEVVDISAMTSSMQLDWTLDAVSQMTTKVIDPELRWTKANYFQRRRILQFEDNGEFEIAACELNPGPGNGVTVTIEARRRSIQRMKRDKNTQSYANMSSTDFARLIADKYGLDFAGQPTPTKKVVLQTNTKGKAESVWDVLRRAASDAQYAVFESDGKLYFGSETWLIDKWEDLQLTWPPSPNDELVLMEVPNCRASDNDDMEAEFSAILVRENATSIRPGMTISLSGIGEFDRKYLVTQVQYEEGVDTPVAISARTAKKPEEE